jgi:hypothetical protein
MSRKISMLLDQPEPMVNKLLSELEDKNGYPSHDARHIAENSQKVRLKIVALGLDPEDTTGEELYHALINKYKQDCRKFDRYFLNGRHGFYPTTSIAEAIIKEHIGLPEVWTLKNKAARNVLKFNSPKRVMKLLNYRSVDSLLKREDVQEIYLASHVLETASWHKAVNRAVAKLNQFDFELRPLKLVNLNYRRWVGSVYQRQVIADNDVGAIAIWPSDESQKIPLLTMVLLLAEELSAYKDIKLGHTAVKTGPLAIWWADMDHLLADLQSEHVSLSLKDTAVNALHNRSYSQRVLDHARTSFWRELVERYENRPLADGLFDRSVKDRLRLINAQIPEPAFEFAEEFHG